MLAVRESLMRAGRHDRLQNDFGGLCEVVMRLGDVIAMVAPPRDKVS